jgi:DNA-binding LacI/PurR family transcriptional regulator
MPGGVTVAVTIKQIAERAGVSLPTVSHVLNKRGHFSSATIEKVFSVARDLGYTPNGTARAMRNQRTRQVGVVYLNEPGRLSVVPYNHYLISGLNAGLEAAGYVLCLVRSSELSPRSVDTEAGTAHAPSESRVFREKVLDGAVVLNQVTPAVEKRIEQLVPAVVWADTNHWHSEDCIRRDEREAGELAARKLIAGGSRRIAWIGAPPVMQAEGDHYSFSLRREGALAAVRAAGVEWNEVSVEPEWSDETHRLLRPFLTESDPARRFGILAYDGVYRGPLVMTAAMLERRLPGVDFALVACDDSPLVTDLTPMLTRVQFDRVELGRQAAEMIIQKIEHPEQPCASRLHHDRLVEGSTSRLSGTPSGF